jgi:hypothetical protein
MPHDIAADAWRLSSERASLEARREAIFRAAFPEAKVVVDPELQMRRSRTCGARAACPRRRFLGEGLCWRR